MRKQALLYLTITGLCSCVFWALIITRGHTGNELRFYFPCLMWCPAVAAFVTCRRFDIKLSTLGLRWGGWRYAAIGYLTPLTYAAIAYGLVWGLGLGLFPNADGIALIAQKLGWSVNQSREFIPRYFAFVGTISVILAVTSALGEEIGWRGFLTPLMVQRLGFTRGSVLIGLIWALWHMPILLFADYNNGTPWWYSIPCFCLLTVSVSVILSWLRLASASVWPCAILHASHNAFIQFFFTPLTRANGTATAYAIDEFGWAVPVLAGLFALVICLRRRRALPPQQALA
jgi:membrane protease YdiL (CAAX protease family)